MKENPPEEKTTNTPPKDNLSGSLFDKIKTAFSVLGAVSATMAITGVISIVVGLIIINLMDELRIFGNIVTIIGLVAVIISAVISYRQVRSTLSSRRGRYGSTTIIMIVAFTGILGIINFLVIESPARIDMTATKQYSLAPRTISILKDLPEDVQVTGFFSQIDANQQLDQKNLDNLLHEFSVRSDGTFEYRFVDPDLDPTLANEYQIPSYGTIVLEGKDSTRRFPLFAPGIGEQELVTGLLIVSGQEQKPVYILTGHGERSVSEIDPTNEQGFHQAVQALQEDLYQVSQLNLLADGYIDNSAAAIIIAGPTKDLADSEKELLDNYLLQGGRIVIMIEQETPDSWRDFLQNWGITVHPGYILDEGSFMRQNPLSPVVTEHGPAFASTDEVNADIEFYREFSNIFRNVDPTFYVNASAISPARPKNELDFIKFGELAMSSPYSGLVDGPDNPQIVPGSPPPPYTIAAVVLAAAPLNEEPTANSKEATIIVFGDSDFAINRNFSSAGNSDLFVNAVNWLAGDVNLISIRPKRTVFREFFVTDREFQFIRISSWFLLPIIMVIAAVTVWWRRR